jgi:hypothetical protein
MDSKREDSMPRLTAIATFTLCSIASIGAAEARRCMVSDPTGTPLNARSEPGGVIVDALPNGIFVRLIREMVDSKGNVWAEIHHEGLGYNVWVFREFISCR